MVTVNSHSTSGPHFRVNTASTVGSANVPFSCAIFDDNSAGGGGGVATGYQTIQDEGTGLAARTTLNFVGTAISCADTAGKTTCTVDAGTSAAPSIAAACSSGQFVSAIDGGSVTCGSPGGGAFAQFVLTGDCSSGTCSLAQQTNITSVAHQGTGSYLVTMTSYGSTNYNAVCSGWRNGTGTVNCFPDSVASSTQFYVRCVNNSDTDVNRKFGCVVY